MESSRAYSLLIHVPICPKGSEDLQLDEPSSTSWRKYSVSLDAGEAHTVSFWKKETSLQLLTNLGILVLFLSLSYGIYLLNTRLKNAPFYKQAVMERLATWLIFSVVFAMLPIIFKVFSTSLVGKQLSWPALVGDGELLIVSAGICAEATGRILNSRHSEKLYKIMAGGATIVMLSLSSFLFAASVFPSTANVGSIVAISLNVFTVSMLTSAVCVVLGSDLA